MGKNWNAKMSVMIATSKIQDKRQKCKSGKKYEKKASKKGRKSPNF